MMTVLKKVFGLAQPPLLAHALLRRLNKRAEDLTPDEQAKSFVSINRIEESLLNRDNRILFGRRGTGKTHILSFVASKIREAGDVAVFVDLRTIGSNNSIYSDASAEPRTRVTSLIRDLVSAIHDGLMETYTEPHSNLSGNGVDDAIGKLGRSVRTIIVNEFVEATSAAAQSQRIQAGASAHLAAKTTSLHAEMGGGASATGSTSEEEKESKTTRGTPRLIVDVGDAYTAFKEIGQGSQKRVWILLDEWSSVPEALQPYLADFLRRAVFPVQNTSVHIAAIEYRTRAREDFEGQRVGFELGADIFADINLDDFFVYENNPETSLRFFRDLLYKHLVAMAGGEGLVEKDPAQVTSAAFTQEPVFKELVRASEGVPRDFINILQLSAMRAGDNPIAMNNLKTAAKDWYERDKERNIDTNPRAQALLSWIRDRVIMGRKCRAFLLKASTRDQSMEFLFDERLLHIAKRSYSAKDDPGVRYRVWKVDYGCYVDLQNTANAPKGYLFEGIEAESAGDVEVPQDDYRAVRRAVLDLEDSERAQSRPDTTPL